MGNKSRKHANDYLRGLIDLELKSKGEIDIKPFIYGIKNRNFSLSPGRIACLIRERDDVTRIQNGVWRYDPKPTV